MSSDDDVGRPVRAKWTGVFLVCDDCIDRGSGPKDKPRTIVAAVHQAAKKSGERARVATTGCLGLCPKRATAVAHVGVERAAQIVAVRSKKNARDAVVALSNPDSRAVAG